MLFKLFKQFKKEYKCAKAYWDIINSQNDTYVPGDMTTEKPKMYVLVVRQKLTLVQCGVQSAHAAIDFMAHYGHLQSVKDWNTKSNTLIFLEATEEQIKETVENYSKIHLASKLFYETDMGNVITACAFEPIAGPLATAYFRKFKLLF